MMNVVLCSGFSAVRLTKATRIIIERDVVVLCVYPYHTALSLSLLPTFHLPIHPSLSIVFFLCEKERVLQK